LETERLLLPVLGCGTVCQLTLFRVTHFLVSSFLFRQSHPFILL